MLAVLFVATGVASCFVSNEIAGPLLLALAVFECAAVVVARVRRSPSTSFGRVWDVYVSVAISSLVMTTLFVLGGSEQNSATWWTGMGFAMVTLLLAALGGSLVASPFFRVPSVTPLLTVFLGGFVLSSVAMQWRSTAFHVRPSYLGMVEVVALVATALVITSAVPLLVRLRSMNRTNEAWSVLAAVAFSIGQPLILRPGGTTHIGIWLGIPLVALGFLMAGSWSATAATLGQPVVSQTQHPTRSTAALVLTILAISLAISVPFYSGWSRRATVLMGVAVVAQAVALAWSLTHRVSLRRTADHRANHVLRQELRTALLQGGVEAHYQPIYRATDRQTAGFECLARWNHPRLGLLTANDFLGVASRDDLLNSIDQLMLTTTLDNLDLLLGELNVDEPFVSVNVHPQRFERADFVEEIAKELARRGRDGTGLVMELTEHVGIANWEQFVVNVTALQHLGIGVAVDDFGAGHANYSLLLRFDPDYIKLDKSLYDAAAHSDRGLAILKSAINAANAVGALVVVEGIEDAAAVDGLALLGADFIQGFAFSRARPLASVADPSLDAA
jgi:EAL domain-containing protein (putative c-di-GMP-specific phosphodiesterase class I)